jgi:hypothetical protein
VISPLLSNLYLTEVDRMLEKAIAADAALQHQCARLRTIGDID